MQTLQRNEKARMIMLTEAHPGGQWLVHTADGPRLVEVQSRPDGTYVAIEIGGTALDQREARVTAESAEAALSLIVERLAGAAVIPLPRDWQTRSRLGR